MTCKCESITSHSASRWVNMLLSVAVAWGSHIASLPLTVLAPKPLAVVRLWWWSWCCYCYLPCMFHCIAMVSCFVSSELVPPITLCYLSWWCMYILELFNFGWWRPHSTNNGITASPPGTTQPYVQSHEGTRRHHPLQWWCTAMMTQSIIIGKKRCNSCLRAWPWSSNKGDKAEDRILMAATSLLFSFFFSEGDDVCVLFFSTVQPTKP